MSKYYFYQPGSIPGFPGTFPANSIVEIDDVTNALLGITPIFPGGSPLSDAPSPDVQAIATPDIVAVEVSQPAATPSQPQPTPYSNGG